MKRRIISIIMVIAMVVTMLPLGSMSEARAFSYAFEVQPEGGEVAGPNKLSVSWKLNFTPKWVQVYRDRSSAGLENQAYQNRYGEDMYQTELPWSIYPYYIVAHYEYKTSKGTVEGSIRSNSFMINQIGAYTKQPVGGDVAGPDKLKVSWELNFTPSWVQVYRDRSGELNNSGDPLADQAYQNRYGEDMYQTELPWSKYPYYIVAYYTIDGIQYSLRSENFTINQIGKFTKQPVGGNVAGSDKLEVSWELNYTPSWVQVYRDRSSAGMADQAYQNRYGEDMYQTELPWSDYPYYIVAYYTIDGIQYSFKSEKFYVNQIGKFTVQPQGGEAAGSETLDVEWSLNYTPTWVQVYRDRSSDDMADQSYRNLYEENMYGTSLPASKYPYYIVAYFTVDGIQYSFTSEKFNISQNADAPAYVFVKEADGGEVAGSDTLEVNWEFNFTPSWVQVYRDRSGDGMADQAYQNRYGEDMYKTKLPWSKYTYYIVGYYTVDGVQHAVRGDNFEIKQIGKFVVQPQGGEVAGSNKLNVNWEFNFTPTWVQVYRDRSSAGMSDQNYQNRYEENMYKTELPACEYPYYVVAYYVVDGVQYSLRSENFTVEQVAEYTIQPEGGQAAGSNKLSVNWELNFEPSWVQVYRDRSSAGMSDQAYQNRYGEDMYKTELPACEYPYYIVAYYTIDGVQYSLRSENFMIEQIGAFTNSPQTVYIRKGTQFDAAWEINYEPSWVQIYRDRSSYKDQNGNSVSDQNIANRYQEDMYKYSFSIDELYPYYIKAYYTIDGVQYSVESERFYVFEAPAAQSVELLDKETIYTGEELRPAIKVLDINGDEIDPSEYTVSYSDNVEIGTGKILVTFLDKKYTGTLEGTFDIHVHNKTVTKKASYGTAGTETIRCSICGHTESFAIAAPSVVTLSQTSYTKDGKAKKPAVTVKDTDGNVITAEHYSVNYTNNINAGTAKATITFKGDRYEGSISKTFTIKELTVITGKCGTDAKYKLDLTTGLMTIYGSGDMEDYQYSSKTPWYKYRDKIKKVSIGSNITRIGTNAFYGCANLTETTGCANVKSIGINTFRNCPVLTKVAGCTKCTLVEQYAFCGSNRFATIGSTAGTVNLPACTKIGGYTFYECKGIKKLVTSSAMTYIGTRSFSNCTAMTAVTIGSACKTIGSYAFCGNTSLTTVAGCAGLTGIGDFAFYNNGKLTSVAGCTKVTNVGKSIFRNCTALTKVGATAGQIKFAAAKAVGEYAFSGCKAAKVIDIGVNVTSIGQYAFQNNAALTKLYIRSSKLTTVGDHALKGIMATAVIYVPAAKLTAYKNGVLKGKGQGIKVTIKGITA